MVDINPINPQSISVNTVPIGSININNTSSNSINSSTNADAQLAYSWAVGTGLIQGIDYSSKTYAQLAKVSEDIASGAISNIEEIEQQALDSITTGIGEIETAKEGALSLIDTTKDDAIEDVEDAESTALTNINTTTQTRITEIENTASDFEADLTLLTQRAETAATSAESSAINANSSATSADTSATAAATSASNASNSESNAQDSATAAATSASNANQSATSASNSASDAAISASSASTSATNASNYATSSSTSATSAANSASAALIYETNAANSANDASDYADNASTSATSASTSASNAATSESNASTYASNAYSFASSASLSATNAGNSASSASQSETNAQSYMNSANTYASNASTSATNAATSETNASNSAIAAATSEDNAEIWAEGTDEQVQALGGVHSSKMWSEISASGQINSDWAETDTTSKAYILNKPTNYVTTDTAQNISGRKTFLGEKAIYFKQNATTDKLGFTLCNPSGTELGALEWRPNTMGRNSLLALNCPQATGGYVGFRYWGSPAVNIVAPKVATAGNYFIPVNITDGTNTVTANSTGKVNISTLLPDVSNFVTNSSLATTLADYVTNANLTTILSDYVLISSLSTVATSGSYNDLTNKPTIPSEVTESTVSGWGFTKNTGTVTSVNNITPVNGNVNLTIPDTSNLANKDLSNLSSTGNSKFQSPLVSGTNIKTINSTSLLGSGDISVLQNTATGTASVTILGNPTNRNYALNVGYLSFAQSNYSTAVGYQAEAREHSTAIGYHSNVNTYSAIQLGYGTNDDAKTLSVGFYDSSNPTNYQLLDGTTGLIPDARISSNIARTSAIPTQASDISAADTTLSNVSSIDSNSAVQTALDGKVSKSGDTMTGNLRIRKSYPVFKAESTDIRRGQTPSVDYYGDTFMLTDIDGNGMGSLSQIYFASGKHTTRLWQRGANSDVYSVLDVGMTENDVPYCSFPNTTCVDGQWENFFQNIIQTAVSVNGSTDLPYTVTVPNDGHVYEYIIQVDGNTGNVTGNWFIAMVKSNVISDYIWICGTATQGNRTAGSQGSAIIPIKYGTDNLYLRRNSNYNGTVRLQAVARRRLGTNS